MKAASSFTPVPFVEKHIISLATFRRSWASSSVSLVSSSASHLSLALLLRAGALAAPMYIVEERTIGPSLGADNIELGVKSVTMGMDYGAVVYVGLYRAFGVFANIALAMNLVLVDCLYVATGRTL